MIVKMKTSIDFLKMMRNIKQSHPKRKKLIIKFFIRLLKFKIKKNIKV